MKALGGFVLVALIVYGAVSVTISSPSVATVFLTTCLIVGLVLGVLGALLRSDR